MIMEKVKVTNLAKFCSLFLIYERPHHGYEIMKKVSKRLGRRTSPGQLYHVLALLEDKGYLKSRETGERDKKVYSLTMEGKVFVKEMLARFGDIMQSAVESSIKKCAHCECEIYRGGYEKKSRGKTLTFCCRNCAGAYK